jgi:hypothetical protein
MQETTQALNAGRCRHDEFPGQWVFTRLTAGAMSFVSGGRRNVDERARLQARSGGSREG